MKSCVFEELPQFVQQNQDASGLLVSDQSCVALSDPVNDVSIGKTGTALDCTFDRVDDRQTVAAGVPLVHNAHESTKNGPSHRFPLPGNQDGNVAGFCGYPECIISKAFPDEALKASPVAREPMRDQQCEAGLARTIVARESPGAFS